MPVTGIGGIFFRAKDTKALSAWYRDHLGVGGGGYGIWTPEAGTSLFLPFEETSDMIPEGKSFMLNFRVTEIDALIASLQAAGIAVKTDPAWDTPETGRFARIHDPEGNAVELWQPPVE